MAYRTRSIAAKVERSDTSGKQNIANITISEANNRTIVQAGYDQIAQLHHDWTKAKQPHRLRYARALVRHLPLDNATVLEIGCGAGVPILQLLTQHASKVYANDISPAQIALAAKNCPGVTFLPGDMARLSLPPSSQDAVTAFFSIFHLPRQEQPAMLQRIRTWLKPQGIFAFNLASTDDPEIRGNFLGADMFWSSFDVETSTKMVADAGFEILQKEVLGSGGEGIDSSDPDYGIEFLWFLVRKSGFTPS